MCLIYGDFLFRANRNKLIKMKNKRSPAQEETEKVPSVSSAGEDEKDATAPGPASWAVTYLFKSTQATINDDPCILRTSLGKSSMTLAQPARTMYLLVILRPLE